MHSLVLGPTLHDVQLFSVSCAFSCLAETENSFESFRPTLQNGQFFFACVRVTKKSEQDSTAVSLSCIAETCGSLSKLREIVGTAAGPVSSILGPGHETFRFYFETECHIFALVRCLSELCVSNTNVINLFQKFFFQRPDLSERVPKNYN